ncbi:13065_t:CDS:2 [Entrophospora sp. SA101]|nr:13065_t:CDS:2 [Entrophospora sp. SA101]
MNQIQQQHDIEINNQNNDDDDGKVIEFGVFVRTDDGVFGDDVGINETIEIKNCLLIAEVVPNVIKVINGIAVIINSGQMSSSIKPLFWKNG